MKLSIVSTNPTEEHIVQIVKAVKQRQLPVEVVNFNNIAQVVKKLPSLGEVIYWRASSLGVGSHRTSAAKYFKDRNLINDALFKTPFVPYKLYQQNTVAAAGIPAIPTYRYLNYPSLEAGVKSGELKLPFIVKPDLGAHGKNIKLIRNLKEASSLTDWSKLVFQNYVPNRGDWRVLILGGRVLGVIKRTNRGKLVNNVSQGGRALAEKNQAVIGQLLPIAIDAAAALGLTFCGIDIIKDEKTAEYYFLEANTAPEWMGGFQPATGVNVANQLVDFCKEVAGRNHQAISAAVEAYYLKSLAYPGVKADDAFHFTSRMLLWTGKSKYRRLIKQLKPQYLGKPAEIRQLLKSYLSQELVSLIPERQKYFKKYPRLRSYNRVLFKIFFAKTIYGLKLDPLVKSLKIETDMIKLYRRLGSDLAAIKVLSTHAVNFFYLFGQYAKTNPTIRTKIKLLDNGEIAGLVEQLVKKRRLQKLDIYLITHAIIVASDFYQHAVDGQQYIQLLKLAEKAIKQNFFGFSLDIKLELLVCAKLCNYQSSLEPMILNEAGSSLSASGNYLVDKLNNTADRRAAKNRLWQSEHRSVLFLMAVLPFRNAGKKS